MQASAAASGLAPRSYTLVDQSGRKLPSSTQGSPTRHGLRTLCTAHGLPATPPWRPPQSVEDVRPCVLRSQAGRRTSPSTGSTRSSSSPAKLVTNALLHANTHEIHLTALQDRDGACHRHRERQPRARPSARRTPRRLRRSWTPPRRRPRRPLGDLIRGLRARVPRRSTTSPQVSDRRAGTLKATPNRRRVRAQCKLQVLTADRRTGRPRTRPPARSKLNHRSEAARTSTRVAMSTSSRAMTLCVQPSRRSVESTPSLARAKPRWTGQMLLPRRTVGTALVQWRRPVGSLPSRTANAMSEMALPPALPAAAAVRLASNSAQRNRIRSCLLSAATCAA